MGAMNRRITEFASQLLSEERIPMPTVLRDYANRALRVGYLPNYRHPRTLHEKLMLLATDIPDPRRAQLADKLFAKRYVAQVAPTLRFATLLQVARHPREFDLSALPSVAVLKSNNSTKDIRVLQAPYHLEELEGIVRDWQAKRWPAWQWRIESHYLAIEPRIFFEEFIGVNPAVRIGDYRFHVFHGTVQLLHHSIRYPDGRRDRFIITRDWESLPVVRRNKESRRFEVRKTAPFPPKPPFFDDLVAHAEALGAPFPYVRVDLYHERNSPYFGEFTFTPNATFSGFRRDWELRFGAHLDIERARRELAGQVPIRLA
jgi:hypothetical protein